MRALFVQQDHVSPVGPVGAAFADRGYDVSELLVVPEEHFHAPSVTADFPDPRDVDVVVAMGAPWSVYDHDRIGSWVFDEMDFLRAAHETGVPVLGICFGAQALAGALGGEVVPAARPEVGWTLVRTERPDLVEAGPWFQWHGDRWVLPSHVSAFATTDVAEQAFTLGRSLGVQFHPEITPTMLAGWLANGGDAQARRLGYDPDELLRVTRRTAPEAEARARRLVERFLDVVATNDVPAGRRLR
ncbi:MAG TPA: gamma-glutamyl-gamma-aminobutyrate hydrolase family protein [Actinomycetes bacterium]|nr:gamma-glutamyl-gamma-aminobutyrate hydrolase family protein [Actinomycetes bacterium]